MVVVSEFGKFFNLSIMMSHNVTESNQNTTAITKEVPILEINLIKSND